MFYRYRTNDTTSTLYAYYPNGLLYTDTIYSTGSPNGNPHSDGTARFYTATGKIANTYEFQFNYKLNAWEKRPFYNFRFHYNANDDYDTTVTNYTPDVSVGNCYIAMYYYYKPLIVSETPEKATSPTDFHLWPNPAFASLSLEADFANGTNQKINVSIYNLHGIEVFHKDYKPSPHFYKTIAIESLPKGLYFISIAQGGSARQKSFFKN